MTKFADQFDVRCEEKCTLLKCSGDWMNSEAQTIYFRYSPSVHPSPRFFLCRLHFQTSSSLMEALTAPDLCPTSPAIVPVLILIGPALRTCPFLNQLQRPRGRDSFIGPAWSLPVGSAPWTQSEGGQYSQRGRMSAGHTKQPTVKTYII